jgi:Zn-finger nucleic acid-binding protein
MKCPNCNVNLLIAERQGIEIDYCPDCRGVWLDRGELDKIIERSLQPQIPQSHESYNREPYNHDHDDYNHNKHHDYYKNRRKGWLGELFD